MTTTTETAPEPNEIEALLPWHAAGTLSRRDAERCEAALRRDPALVRQYILVREELAETIFLNETLGAPSVRAMERLFARIDAEGGARKRSSSLPAWIAARLSRLSPRALAWSAGAAVFAIVLQAGLIAGLSIGGGERGGQTTSQTASYPDRIENTGGAYALIAFKPQASVADITKFLESHHALVVDGPRAAGMYKVRVGAAGLPREELARAVRRMQDASGIVRFAAPTE